MPGMLCLAAFLFFSAMPLGAQNMYLELNLNEAPSGNPFARAKPPLEAFRVIEKASNDKKVRGIILNAGSINYNRDYLWELRRSLEQFKSHGKKVVAFISNADMDIYSLASIADKIVMDELGTLNMLGYSVSRGYVKNALEKLGIGVRELRYFEYKSAAETFTRDSMSDADKRQYNDYLDDIYNLTRSTVINARNISQEEFDAIVNNDFLYSARDAKNKKLVDYTGRNNAVKEAIKEIEGGEIDFFALYGDSASGLTSSAITYSPPKAKRTLWGRPGIIAVVYANGQTDMHNGMEALKLSEAIRELADRRRVKAVVIRMNSPGGSAEAADYFAEAVRYAKQKKPVVVSMGEVAASGGYWSAMNASHITATPYTVTGSIGVIGNWFFDNGINSKLGLNMDGLKRGEHSDLLSGFLIPHRDLGADEEERYKSFILDLYNVFIEKVAAGRGMDGEKVEAAAQGRIFSGTRALEAGLVDSLGGLTDAIRTARTLAKIPEKRSVRYEEYPRPKFFERLLENFPLAKILFNGKNSIALPSSAMQLFLPEGIQYRLENNGRAMPILPLEFMY
jgi:protease-4